ncbi:pyrroline-5-carboxylate reductase [Buchananella hordeovulneris]|uniref:pyrroline-5-carboxylate reductase n=1 Tax=Buchananella hordeovulneris TaxID=52770 RepID=UPI0026DBBA12|nr:pyrroline-5-carboxylate reductase [Buchananella hordeovulneris]MDO5080140.1 pyrroline-5-carboxylate reductase [Buchananella hordeovulneris]
MRIGFVGTGVMATAIVRGAVQSGRYAPGDIFLFDTAPAKAAGLAAAVGAQALASAAAVARACDLLVLAVKPHVILPVLSSLAAQWAERPPVVVSIAAGTPLAQLEEAAGPGVAVVRVMPNLAATLGEAMTAVAGGQHASAAQVAAVEDLFAAVGRTAQVPEAHFAAFTALAGSSPAFAFEFVDALARAGVIAGIPKDQAVVFAAQALAGAAQLVLAEADAAGRSPATLVDQVCSPGGTTVAGMAALDAHGFRAAILAAARAVMTRDAELNAK